MFRLNTYWEGKEIHIGKGGVDKGGGGKEDKGKGGGK